MVQSSNSSGITPAPRLAAASVAAMGVVYGDIGTSPLYTMREVFNGPHAVAVTPENLLGILSLIFWALLIVITLKYVIFILRAGALFPMYRTSALLEQLKGKVFVPAVLFYPGDLDGAAGLRFMGILDAEHNYRPKIF